MAGDFVDLHAWQEAAALAADIVRISRSVRGPASPTAVDQLLRAAESIPANIAEGYGRGLSRDFARFLRIARASAAELESHLRVAEVAGRLRTPEAAPAVARCRRVRALIHGLLLSVESRAG